ncbi:MAG: FAD-binding oxidoreductase [Anaerolineae bacterium]|nr:FAD-binding oxidoreductase [Anaerolineae bacterium]
MGIVVEGERRVDTCDAVIVGAGIVGAAVAARLAERGMQVAVLDAQGVASGATGRSADMIVTGLSGDYRWAVETFGRERARELWALSAEGRAQFVRAANRLGVTLEQPGSLLLAVTEEEKSSLWESAKMLQEDGFPVQFRDDDPLDRGFQAALRQPDDAVVDAADLTRALLSSVPLVVQTNTEVHSIRQEGDWLWVSAQRMNTYCKLVVLAVDGHAPLLDKWLAQWIAPAKALLATTEPLPEPLISTPCRVDYGYEYVRPLPDNRLLLGAWRRSRPQVARGRESLLQDNLARFAEQYFPEVQGKIASRRFGTMGLTPDGLPIVGHLPHLSQVAFALGFGGWGLNWALVAAERLAGWLLDGAELGFLAVERLQAD